MNLEKMEVEIKTIILKNCTEAKSKNVAQREYRFSPSVYRFNEKQFDTMSLQLIHYINQNYGGGKQTKRN